MGLGALFLEQICGFLVEKSNKTVHTVRLQDRSIFRPADGKFADAVINQNIDNAPARASHPGNIGKGDRRTIRASYLGSDKFCFAWPAAYV